MIKEFKEYNMRGDVLNHDVGDVIRRAFTCIVDHGVHGGITPLI
ncbi:MscL family protein, partial [Enterococcus faecium]